MFDFIKKRKVDNFDTILKINDASIMKKLQEEGYTSNRAQVILEDIKTVQPKLFPLIEAWYAGAFINYKFKGVSITSIMKQLNCDYLAAITWMDSLIKEPDTVKDFKYFELKQR